MAKSVIETREIPLVDIVIGDQALRVTPEDDSIAELAEGIAKNGLLQPVGVFQLPDGRYQLLWGGRRLAAHRRLKRDVILARLFPAKPKDVKAIALIENLQRQQLSLGEESAGVVEMVETQGMSVEQVAAALSKSRSWVLQRLSVSGLPEFIRGPLLDGDLPMTHVEALGKLQSESAQRYLVSQCLQQRWNLSQMKQMCQMYESAPSVGEIEPLAAGGVPGVQQSNIPKWTCQVCSREGEIFEFALVRVCKDGCESRPVGDGPVGDGVKRDGLGRV